MWLGLEDSTHNKNLLLRKCENIFEGQKKAFDNKESGASYYYRFPEDKIRPEANVLTDTRIRGKGEAQAVKLAKKEGRTVTETELQKSFVKNVNEPIPMIRVASDGSEEKGVLYVTSDDITDLPSEGKNPSYGMFFLKEGKRVPYPIYSPENIGNMERFSITQEDMKEANSIKAKRDEAEYNKILYWRNVQNLIHEKRLKEGEPYEAF
jgi:hypothetical protein